MQNRKLTPCPSCQAYYAIPPNQFCEHCATGRKHQFHQEKIKTDEPEKPPVNDLTRVVIGVENSEIQRAMDLITNTFEDNKVGMHPGIIALTFLLMRYEKKIGAKVEVNRT